VILNDINIISPTSYNNLHYFIDCSRDLLKISQNFSKYFFNLFDKRDQSNSLDPIGRFKKSIKL